ncbi:MAG: hypothetical protein JEY71_12665 [Sphaerochaeta sp.]|nr:hypothetical protein [Sphaerochaeta sp.]
MKRIFSLLIVLTLLSGCSTLHNQKEVGLDEIRTALREVVQTASERIEATMHAQMTLTTLIPPSSASLLEQKQIPRLEEHLELWSKQVITAFRGATIAMSGLLNAYIGRLVIVDPLSVMQESDSSGTALLLATYQKDIENEVRSMLKELLSPSEETYQMLTDRYAIWSRSKALLGEESLPPLGNDLTDHLIKIFLSSYLSELTKGELYLRTTPVFQGTGSFYEILNKKAQQ